VKLVTINNLATIVHSVYHAPVNTGSRSAYVLSVCLLYLVSRPADQSVWLLRLWWMPDALRKWEW